MDTPAPRSRLFLPTALAAAALAQGACLPGDTRPVPGSLFVSVSPSPAVSEGFDTEDGYRVRFERLVSAVGDLDLERDDADCNRYAAARYDRLFDFTVADGQKVGVVWGLGACRLRFRLRAPSFEALLGPGATASDRELMRIRASDRFADDERASVLVRGEATGPLGTKRFDWVFRRGYNITNCEAPGDGYVTTVALEGGEELSLALEVRGEELFRAAADPQAPLRFAPFAEADADGDGDITLDELDAAPRPPFALPDAGTEPPSADDTLEELVYTELLPRLLAVAGGGDCEATVRASR